MISRFEKFSFSIAEIHRYLHKISADEMEKYGLKGSHAVYLLALHRYEDGITAAELSEKCDRNKADVSRAVATMEKEGLARREGAAYRARILLTDDGKKAAESVGRLACRAVDMGSSGLTEEQRNNMYYALELIADNLRNISKEGLKD